MVKNYFCLTLLLPLFFFSCDSLNSRDPKIAPLLLKKLEEAGPTYKPRTKHLLPNGRPQFSNRLLLETSPYLLQHAHNPVNWYPWGDEAFQKAKELGRPVFLSIGYSTCHWCHVMEEESFEDLEIAKTLNENYIAVKVDREERPDVDSIYMSAVQALTGGGGWPLNVWLSFDRKPFFGGTYFPARNSDTSVGFLTLLKKLYGIYVEEPAKIQQEGLALVKIINERLSPLTDGQLPAEEPLHQAAKFYKSVFDTKEGGLAQAPKFPSSLPMRFLMRYYRRTGKKEYLRMAVLTLQKMQSGGIYDHVAGGFHRYATDRKWLVPHFEKMLYDNALLAVVYLEAFQLTGNRDFERVTREILDYVLRDMTSPEGGFYSATDADSRKPNGHHEEGYFFTWTAEEIGKVLDEEDAGFLKRYYAVLAAGNFEGRNILNTPLPMHQIAKEFKIDEATARKRLNLTREKLYRARLKRPHPLRDEKVITSWNGLMISALAQAGFVLNEGKYTEAAKNAANFLLAKCLKEGRLFRSYMQGRAGHNAYLDDHASLISAFLNLYESTSDLQWLQNAISLQQTLEERYADEKNGGFFMTSHDHEPLLVKEKPIYDGAEPSGNSMALHNLLRLHGYTGQEAYQVRALQTFKAFSGIIQKKASAFSEMLLAWDFHLDLTKEIVLVIPEGKKDANQPLLTVLRKKFLPNRVLAVVTEGKELLAQSKLIPLLENKRSIGGKTTAYVCKRGICLLPTTDPGKLEELLSEIDMLRF